MKKISFYYFGCPYTCKIQKNKNDKEFFEIGITEFGKKKKIKYAETEYNPWGHALDHVIDRERRKLYIKTGIAIEIKE